MGKRLEKLPDKVGFPNDQEAYEMIFNFVSY